MEKLPSTYYDLELNREVFESLDLSFEPDLVLPEVDSEDTDAVILLKDLQGRQQFYKNTQIDPEEQSTVVPENYVVIEKSSYSDLLPIMVARMLESLGVPIACSVDPEGDNKKILSDPESSDLVTSVFDFLAESEHWPFKQVLTEWKSSEFHNIVNDNLKNHLSTEEIEFLDEEIEFLDREDLNDKLFLIMILKGCPYRSEGSRLSTLNDLPYSRISEYAQLRREGVTPMAFSDFCKLLLPTVENFITNRDRYTPYFWRHNAKFLTRKELQVAEHVLGFPYHKDERSTVKTKFKELKFAFQSFDQPVLIETKSTRRGGGGTQAIVSNTQHAELQFNEEDNSIVLAAEGATLQEGYSAAREPSFSNLSVTLAEWDDTVAFVPGSGLKEVLAKGMQPREDSEEDYVYDPDKGIFTGVRLTFLSHNGFTSDSILTKIGIYVGHDATQEWLKKDEEANIRRLVQTLGNLSLHDSRNIE